MYQLYSLLKQFWKMRQCQWKLVPSMRLNPFMSASRVGSDLQQGSVEGNVSASVGPPRYTSTTGLPQSLYRPSWSYRMDSTDSPLMKLTSPLAPSSGQIFHLSIRSLKNKHCACKTSAVPTSLAVPWHYCYLENISMHYITLACK